MLRYGIPSFKLEKDVIDAEIDVLRELGVDVDPTTFTVEQAVPQLRALLEGRAHA